MSDVKRNENDDADPTVTDREATAEGENPQDFRERRDSAESHTAFDDDKVTPRLNDGR